MCRTRRYREVSGLILDTPPCTTIHIVLRICVSHREDAELLTEMAALVAAAAAAGNVTGSNSSLEGR